MEQEVCHAAAGAAEKGMHIHNFRYFARNAWDVQNQKSRKRLNEVLKDMKVKPSSDNN